MCGHVQVAPRMSMCGLSLCCRWPRPTCASSTVTSALGAHTQPASTSAAEATRYSPHIPYYDNPASLPQRKLFAAQQDALLSSTNCKETCSVSTPSRNPLFPSINSSKLGGIRWHKCVPATCLPTIVTQPFSRCPLQLVATYHCDQAYAFDVSGTGSCTTSYSTTEDDTTSAAISQEADAVMAEAESAAGTSGQVQGKAIR